jgi:hypothetical protein
VVSERRAFALRRFPLGYVVGLAYGLLLVVGAFDSQLLGKVPKQDAR